MHQSKICGQAMHFVVIAVFALLIALGIAPAHAEKRVALVIGNGAYRHADRLANPVNDARGMRTALTKLGFDVIFGEDLDQRGAPSADSRRSSMTRTWRSSISPAMVRPLRIHPM
jgi:hypothetical protein